MSAIKDKIWLDPKFKRLSERVWVGPQVSLDDLDRASVQGIGRVVCNRPDGEDAGQPTAEVIAAAAEARGMDFLAIPITHAGFGEAQIAALAETLTRDDEVVLAYCRSGTRSTLLWALAEASRGRDPDELAEAARNAGYDVSPVRPAMDRLAAQSR